MLRGLWPAALRKNRIMASSSLTQRCDLAIRPPPFPLPAGLLLPNADLILGNIVSFEARTVGSRATVADHRQFDDPKAPVQGVLTNAARI